MATLPLPVKLALVGFAFLVFTCFIEDVIRWWRK